ncbi:MAG: glycosyl hydrolase [Gemmatimonadota bacterium]
MRLYPIAAFAALFAACAPYSPPKVKEPPPAELPPPRTAPTGAVLQDQVTGTTARFQAISVVSENVVWASGTGGTYAITVNGGRSWRTGVVAGADSLEFRDVQGFDTRTAYLLSSGNGPASRIYRTSDGGQNWQLQFINRDSTAFYDCFAFWDRKSGVAFSDNVAGRFPYLVTADSGQAWQQRYLDGATKGEGAFAASGTCVVAGGGKKAWVATGAGTASHVLFTPDRGTTWEHFNTPIVQGTSTTGHTTLTFRSDLDGLAAGGDIGDPKSVTDNVILTHDGGKSWTLGGRPTFTGAIYGAVYVPGAGTSVVAVGPGGASISVDDGKSWTALDTLAYWSVAFANRQAGWMVGPAGRITKVSF